MIFNSIPFLVFLSIVLALYYALNFRWQNVLLLVASYIFYGWWDARFLGLLAISTLVDFFVAKGISKSKNPMAQKKLLMISIFTNLGILGFFKYFNFFIGSAIDVLNVIGLSMPLPVLKIVLPVGISFYTFQSLSYTIDVYRGSLNPCRNFISFALYVSYFPQLVAGPIERATRLLPQLENPRKISAKHIQTGSFLILFGLFKKVGIADSVAPLVDVIFANPDSFSGLTLLWGLYFFTIQIYCDFSGYSDIARGVSVLLGINLMVNFNQPYFSTSITEFWRRWHISLSSWLRDYLYIPLGGNRCGKICTYRNLGLTMLIGGLWHGSNWTFVVWGGLHGFYLAAEKWIGERRGSSKNREKGPQRLKFISFIKLIATFHLVTLSWAYFRSNSISEANAIIWGILTWTSGKDWIGEFDLFKVALPTCFLLIVEYLQYKSGDHLKILTYHWAVRGLTYASLIIFIVIFGGLDGEVPFIYFQF